MNSDPQLITIEEIFDTLSDAEIVQFVVELDSHIANNPTNPDEISLATTFTGFTFYKNLSPNLQALVPRNVERFTDEFRRILTREVGHNKFMTDVDCEQLSLSQIFEIVQKDE